VRRRCHGWRRIGYINPPRVVPDPANGCTRVWSNNSPWMQTAAPARAARVASAAGAILHSARTMTFSRTVRRLRAICRGSPRLIERRRTCKSAPPPAVVAPRHFDPGAAEGAEVTFVAGSVRLELCGVTSLALRCGLTVRCISAQMRWKPSSDMLRNLRESTTCERCHRYRRIGYRNPPRVVPDSANDAQADEPRQRRRSRRASSPMTGLSGEKFVCSNIEGVVGTFVIRMTGEQPVNVLAGMDIHGEQRDRSGSCPSPSVVAADRSADVSFAGSGTTLARLR
jgi:hypothetical protein